MAKSAGFSISIGVADAATAKLDAINKRLGALGAPAERFGKSIAKFGDVTGINKLAEGMSSLGSNALGAFRAIEQMVAPMAAITSAASIAGIMALEKAWAGTGSTINKTASALNMPASSFSSLVNGFKLARVSAQDAETTISGISKTIYDAYVSHDDKAKQLLAAQGVDYANKETGAMATVGEALDQLSKHLATYADNRTKVNAIESIGGAAGALSALKDGTAAWEDWLKKANAAGANWTEEMTNNAVTVQTDFERLKQNMEGIGNTIADNWSGTADKVMGVISNWIEHNHTLASSITTDVGGAITALTGLKGFAMLMRLLGLGAAVPGAPAVAGVTAAVVGTIAVAKGAEASANTTLEAGKQGYTEVISTDLESGLPTSYRNPTTGKILPAGDLDPRYQGKPDVSVGAWWRAHMPVSVGGDPAAPEAAPAPASAASPPASTASSTPEDYLGTLANSRLGKLLAKGEAGSAGYNAVNRGAAGGYAAGMENLVNKTVAEVQADQAAHKYNAAGRYQIIAPTLAAAVKALHLTGKEQFNDKMQDRIFEQFLVGSKRKEIADYINGTSDDLHGAQMGMAKEWASVADPDTGLSHYGKVGNNKASITPDQTASALQDARQQHTATAGANGQVHVQVTLKGAPPGTTATAIATGSATASPPRVETAMAHIG